MDTGKLDPAKRDAQFERLQKSQEHVLNVTNWHEFLHSLERAGFRGSKMISSDNAVLFSYALWLMGRVDYHVPLDQLREVVARWFFMAHTTTRYSGAFESRFEQDAARLADLQPGDGAGFVGILSKVIDDTTTNDFWTITLPNDLATSASKSPALLAYIAALNILDAKALLSTGRVRSRLDPAITAKKGIERHHIFPRAYLKKVLGLSDTREINQIANMALVEWADNIAISDDAPADYWNAQVAAKTMISADDLARQCYWHALPDDWQHMEYQEFLAVRRKLMAGVVRHAFGELLSSDYSPAYPPAGQPQPLPGAIEGEPPRSVTPQDLISDDVLAPGTTLVAPDRGGNVTATLLVDGKIVVDDEVYSSLSAAAAAVTGGSENGWKFWSADTSDGRFTMEALRAVYLEHHS